MPDLLIGLAIMWLVSRIGPVEMAEAAAISTVVFVVVLQAIWSHRHEKWLWPFMICMGMAHVAVILFFPWSTSHKASKGDLLFVWLDFFLYWGLVSLKDMLTARLFGKSNVP